ncbi:hypothetical protein FRB91_006423 [Serendipita sp. 411]|nr:hypothetical protein FRC18_007601 [Serendipita sp. 400]KAG8852461.1 hypothetical protein FRB91_006423 [Serendipita sp. 411]
MSLHPLRTRRLPRRIVVLVATFVLTGLFITQTTREKRIDLANSALRVPLDKLCRNRINGPTGNWLYDSNLEEKRLTKEDFESGMYKAGSRDTWVFNEEDEDIHWIGDDTDMVLEFEKSANLVDVNKLLSGNLTGRFRDNLRPELRYITGWNDGGFTNQFMGVANLIFLSLLTPTHIPIIPPLVARPHMPVRAGYRAFSDVFDLERLARSMNKEMVEWKDVKDLRGLKGSKMYDGSMKADEQDEIGCWSVWMTAKRDATKPYQGTFLPDHLNLDISYTPMPVQARLFPDSNSPDQHASFYGLARLAQGTSSNRNPISSDPLRPTVPNPHNHNVHLPDTHLTCFDFLYFVSASLVGFEWEQEYSSAWNFVGKYARWNDRIRSLARETLSLTLGLVRRDIMLPVRGDSDWRDDRDGRKFHAHDLRALDERDRILTPFVTIHVRHGDFLSNCEKRKQDGRLCSPPLSTFEALVEEIEDELLERGRVLPHMGKLPVIVTSDETDEAWWTEVQRYGWHRVKFPEYLALPPGVKGREEEGLSEETHRKLWDRLLIEVAIQGYGTGFIGTEGSTMSLVAQRRVEHWQKGTARIVRFSVFDNWD